ncbi:hypothetical protein B0H10DRAFT_2225407 [Mycena sp. CBHHK59/15]|nr:hypothetical protein B0H10DRAFT_2225407 [Mycena sp. CBHHK59/15]
MQHNDDDMCDGKLEEYIDLFGMVVIHDDSTAMFYGRCAGSKVHVCIPAGVDKRQHHNLAPPHLPCSAHGILPLLPGAACPGINLPVLTARLPPPTEGCHLCALYFAQAPSVTSLSPHWFPEGDAAAAAPLVSSSTGTGSTHELALVFVIVWCTWQPFPSTTAHMGDEGELEGKGKDDSGY